MCLCNCAGPVVVLSATRSFVKDMQVRGSQRGTRGMVHLPSATFTCCRDGGKRQSIIKNIVLTYLSYKLRIHSKQESKAETDGGGGE